MKTNCKVAFIPSVRPVALVVARSKARQMGPSPAAWKKGTICEKLSKLVGFWAVEIKTPTRIYVSAAILRVKNKRRLTGPLGVLRVERDRGIPDGKLCAVARDAIVTIWW